MQDITYNSCIKELVKHSPLKQVEKSYGTLFYVNSQLVATTLGNVTVEELLEDLESRDSIDTTITDVVRSVIIKGYGHHTNYGIKVRLGRSTFYIYSETVGDIDKFKVLSGDFEKLIEIDPFTRMKKLLGDSSLKSNLMKFLVHLNNIYNLGD